MLEGLICGFIGSIAAIMLLMLGREFVLARITDKVDSPPDVQALAFGLNALGADRRRPARRRRRLRADAAALPAGLIARLARMARRDRTPRQKRPAPRQRRRRAQSSARAEPHGSLELPRPQRRARSVVAHSGPTNSGKTHDGARILASRGGASTRGRCGCSPRRRTAGSPRRLGAERVGLVTGEERVNDGAPIVCCTVEMAPLARRGARARRGAVGRRQERGSAWTRLMLAGEYRHILLLGALEALPLVRNAFPDAEVKLLRAEGAARVGRRAPDRGARRKGRSSSRSPRAVLALAGEINRRRPGRSPCSTARCRSRRAVTRSTASSTAAPRCASPPTCSATGSTCLRDAALRGDEEVRRAGAARARCRGRSRRSPAAPAGSASSSAATSACSPACRGRIPTPGSSSRR